MLTDEKRKKLLAGALAVVMLTGVAGCGTIKTVSGRMITLLRIIKMKRRMKITAAAFFMASFPGTSSAVPLA